MNHMIPAGIKFQLWYKSNVSLGLIFQGFIQLGVHNQAN
jgi:hypothetical protein